MTTIATDGKSMYSDSRQTGAYIDQLAVKKVYRIKGELWGFAGMPANWLRVIKWLTDGGEPPHIEESFSALQLDKSGMVYEWCKLLQPVAVGSMASTGSGCDYAMAAMMAGASPKKAVKIAKKLDVHSGGKVKGYKL